MTVIGKVPPPGTPLTVVMPSQRQTQQVNVRSGQGPKGDKGDKGDPGAPGAPGAPGITTVVHTTTNSASGAGGPSSDRLMRLSSAPLSATKVVRLDGAAHVAEVSALDVSTAAAAVGVAVTSASTANATVEIALRGEVVDDGWSFQPGLPVFVGADGRLTQQIDRASWAYLRALGTAVTAQRIFVDPQPAIILAGI